MCAHPQRLRTHSLLTHEQRRILALSHSNIYKVKWYLYFVSKDPKSHNHVPRLVYLLQYPNCLREEGRRVRSSILWDCGTEILLITAKDMESTKVTIFSYMPLYSSPEDMASIKNSDQTNNTRNKICKENVVKYFFFIVSRHTQDSSRWCRCQRQAAGAWSQTHWSPWL